MGDAGAYSERHGAGFLRAILERFRRGGAGVPATVSDDLAAELAALFLSLDAVEADAERIRTAAAQRAAAIADEAQAEVEQILSDARERAEAERVRAITSGRQAADAEIRAIDARADAEAEEISRVGRARIAPLVADILRCVDTSTP